MSHAAVRKCLGTSLQCPIILKCNYTEQYALWNEQFGTQVKQLYPHTYQNIAEFTLCDPNDTTRCHKLSHVKEIAVFGSPWTVSWEFIQAITSLPQSVPDTSDWLRECPISIDTIASKLMVEHKCDIAMSTDTLCELLDNDAVKFRNVRSCPSISIQSTDYGT